MRQAKITGTKTTKTGSVKAAIAKGRRGDNTPPLDCLSTGSTLLNLACTGTPDGGFPAGYYIYFVGDTDSGKTFFCLTCLAEAVNNPKFKGYRFVYDGGEFGALMDMGRFFGREVVERLEPPDIHDDDEPKPSWTIESFYFNLKHNLEQGPCIYILDSMDALSSKYEGKKFDEKEREFRGGAEAKGDYGDGKAKVNSAMIRRCIPLLQKTGSILIVINQSRDNPAAGMFESKKTHSGGRALSFYATIKLWSSVSGKIVRQVKGKKRHIGTHVEIKVLRTRVTGKQRSVVVPIYPSVGIDDLGSCVDYLVGEGHWKRDKGGRIDATEFEFKGKADQLIGYIEEEESETVLRRIVSKVWNVVEAACEVERKPRYGKE